MAKRTVASAFVMSLFVVSNATPAVFQEQYYEDLTIRPLADGKVVTAFTFTTLLGGASSRDPRDSESSGGHTSPVPAPSCLQVDVLSPALHLLSTHSRSNPARVLGNRAPSFPQRRQVELRCLGISRPSKRGHRRRALGVDGRRWATFVSPVSIFASHETQCVFFVSVDDRWIGLRNALAGLFCASLGSLDDRRTSSPTSAFPLSSAPFPKHSIPYALRHATLPSEHVCTENLTPFLKLLPCKSRAGLAKLLDPQHVFDADWHGLGIHVRSTEAGVELSLGAQAVLDPVRRSGGKRRGKSQAVPTSSRLITFFYARLVISVSLRSSH
jgi:phosphatidylinositol glycan class T